VNSVYAFGCRLVGLCIFTGAPMNHAQERLPCALIVYVVMLQYVIVAVLSQVISLVAAAAADWRQPSVVVTGHAHMHICRMHHACTYVLCLM
jgi:hypothetical protein